MESKTQPLISLDEYDSALASLDRRVKSWHVPAAIYGLAFAVVGTTLAGQHLILDGDPHKWWKLLIGPGFVLITGIPLIFWVLRRGDRIKDDSPFLKCANCVQCPTERAVRMTGCCDKCGAIIVRLPDGSDDALPGRDAFAAGIRQNTRQATWFLLPPLCAGGLAGVVASVMQNELLMSWAVSIALVLFIVGMVGLSILVFRRDQFECLHCGVNLSDGGHGVPWTMATGRCHRCAMYALECYDPPESGHVLQEADGLRVRIKASRRALLHGYGFMTLLIPIALVSALLRGVPREKTPLWALVAMLPGFAYAMWFGVLARERDPVSKCPSCKSTLSGMLPVVVATGRCPQCYGRVCD